MTLSNSTGPPAHCCGAGPCGSTTSCPASVGAAGAAASVGGSHSSSSSRCRAGTGVNRSLGVIGCLSCRAWWGRSVLYCATNLSTAATYGALAWWHHLQQERLYAERFP